MKRRPLLLLLSSLVILGVAAAGASALRPRGHGARPTSGQPAHASAAHAVVTSKQTSLGTILVTSSGQTLYLDAKDRPGHFACTGMCAAAWPVLSTRRPPRAAGKAKASALGTVKHGKLTQVTYDGHPLYTFTADSPSSPTSGQGINGFYVVSPSGNKITKTTETGTTTTPSGATDTTTSSSTTTSAPTTTPSTATTTTTTTTTTAPTTTSSSSTTTTTTSSSTSYSYSY